MAGGRVCAWVPLVAREPYAQVGVLCSEGPPACSRVCACVRVDLSSTLHDRTEPV